MANQAPIKVSGETKERIRYLAALTDATQAQVVDRAVEEYAARHADAINQGIERARVVLAGGDAAMGIHRYTAAEPPLCSVNVPADVI
jgi:predicted transcriptional regulator